MAATTRPWTRPARPTTGDQALAAAKLAVRRLLELAMGTTRWASPPPEMSIRAAVLIWLLTSIAFALFVLAW